LAKRNKKKNVFIFHLCVLEFSNKND
jgi:hypothetical protein